MFTSLVSAVVLAGAIAMPPIVDNPWAVNKWEPLKAAYDICAEEAHSSFSYYVCAWGAQYRATHYTTKA